MRVCIGTGGERECAYNVLDICREEGVEPILRIIAYYVSCWSRWYLIYVARNKYKSMERSCMRDFLIISNTSGYWNFCEKILLPRIVYRYLLYRELILSVANASNRSKRTSISWFTLIGGPSFWLRSLR